MVSAKENSLGFIFLHFFFSTDQDEILCGVEAIQVEHSDTIFERE